MPSCPSSNRRRLLLVLAALLTWTGAASTPLGASPAVAASASPSTGRFYVVGPDIIAPDGSKFVPVGANVGVHMVSWSPPTYAFTAQGHTATGRVRDALRWGWNMVRVNVVCDPPRDVTLHQTIGGVQRVIDEYTAHKIVVMPVCHDVTGKNPASSDPTFARIHEFWDAIIARNGTNPYVWVNYVNEPFTSKTSDDRWLELGHELYDRVRAKGTENLFVWDFPGWGQGAERLVRPAADPGGRFVDGRCNVALSWHNYGASGTPAQMTAQAELLVRRRLPVIIAEFGYDWAGRRDGSTSYEVERRGGDWTFDNVARFGFGAVYWHATGTKKNDEIHSLRQGGKGAWYSNQYALSHAGQRLYDLGQERPSFPRPQVELSSSNCASSRGGPAAPVAPPPAGAPLPALPAALACPRATAAEMTLCLLYRSVLGRIPDADGRLAWSPQLARPGGPVLVARHLLDSPEFAARHGRPSNRDFVRVLFLNALGREPDDAGFRHFTSLLDRGVPRDRLVAEVAQSPESVSRSSAPALPPGYRDAIERLYRAAFARPSDPGGMAFWAGAVEAGTTLGAVAEAFSGSAEFGQRYGVTGNAQFVTLLYGNVLGRTPDAGGLAHWVGLLESGTPRGGVLLGFAESPEFVARLHARS